jgi:hypothetical protein
VVTTHLIAATSGPRRRWIVTAAATVASTATLEVFVAAGGGLLVASRVLDGTPHGSLLMLLAASYVVWLAALRSNLIVNWVLLEATGTSTNAVSKAAYEIVRLRSGSRRAMRAASMAGYVIAEAAKDAPYYAGAFGTALVSDSVDSSDALVFLVGTNLGAALYESGVARLTAALLERRELRAAAAGPSTADVDTSLPMVGARR